MVRYLKLKLRPIDRTKLDKYKYIAMVDTQPRTGNNSLPATRVPDLVIDHHSMIAPTKKVPFVDIRLAYGATATLLTEYLFHFGLEIDRNLATALLYGIKSETIRTGKSTPKGYTRESLFDAWTRYLKPPSDIAATSETAQQSIAGAAMLTPLEKIGSTNR